MAGAALELLHPTRGIAEYLVRNLSPAGYLQDGSTVQVARKLGYSTLKVEQVIRKLQQLDPFAILARNLAECLWVQAQHPEHPIEDPLVLGIIAKHLHNLEIRNYPAIARDTGEALEEVYEATKVIMAMDPRPARAYSSESAQYITPNVYIVKVGEDFVVTLNEEGVPKLRISAMYREAAGGNPKAKDYIHERMRSAQWLIRSNPAAPADHPQGDPQHPQVPARLLRARRPAPAPLILKDVAEDIEMHESTVSRVTTDKYLHTPQEIFSSSTSSTPASAAPPATTWPARP